MADELNPGATSSEYDAQVAFWNLVNAILGGEDAIKAGGVKYLPKMPNENDTKYAFRLAASPFTNIFGDISRNLASKPFSKEMGMKEGTPEPYLKLAENIDGQGNNLHVFAQTAFKASLDKSAHWILVDFTKARQRPDGRPLTRAEEAEQGLRPYWVHVPAERMLAVYSDFVGGVEVIHHARIQESSKQIDGFQEVSIERVRVLKRDRIADGLGNTIGYGPAYFQLWEQTTGADKKTTWAIIEQGPITIGVIPLVPVVLTDRQAGTWMTTPALRDLAHMQMTEYRQESNLEWIKIMTCFPMIVISGMETKNADGSQVEVTVGPNNAFLIPQNQSGSGPAGTAEFIEPSAQSIVENRNQLELTRKEMRDLGMQPLAQANLTVVTTANVSRKASSAVQAWAFRFKDAMEQAWKFTAMWLQDASFEPEIIIHTDFAVELETGKELDSLLKAQGQGIYSKQTVREEFKRRKIVSNDLSDEEEAERIATEGEDLMGEEEIDPVTGRPIDPAPEPEPDPDLEAA